MTQNDAVNLIKDIIVFTMERADYENKAVEAASYETTLEILDIITGHIEQDEKERR